LSAYEDALHRFGKRLVCRGIDIRVASAESIGAWTDVFDLIYSYDVFEHLPPEVLTLTVSGMMQRLSREGCCLIRLNPFPSITGGHLIEWYAGTLKNPQPRESAPWDHLRNRERGTGDTYLNGLGHRDFLAIFEKHARVIEHFPDDDLGKPFLTSQIKAEFANYTQEELCTTGWTYVLVNKSVE
jgi:hypothetical protein